MPIKKFSLILQNSSHIAPTVKHFVFETDLDSGFDFEAGQFITLTLPTDEKVLRRSYSLANAPSGKNQIEFAASFVEGGRASRILFSLEPGDRIDALGPAGKLVLPEAASFKRYILVATGTGVTPYRSMIPSLIGLTEREGVEVVLVQGARTAGELIYGNEFSALQKESKSFQYVPCLSRDAGTEPFAFAVAGRVQTHLTTMSFHQEQDCVFLCGNPDMIDEVFQLLTEKGLPSSHIKREKYISSN